MKKKKLWNLVFAFYEVIAQTFPWSHFCAIKSLGVWRCKVIFIFLMWRRSFHNILNMPLNDGYAIFTKINQVELGPRSPPASRLSKAALLGNWVPKSHLKHQGHVLFSLIGAPLRDQATQMTHSCRGPRSVQCELPSSQSTWILVGILISTFIDQ